MAIPFKLLYRRLIFCIRMSTFNKLPKPTSMFNKARFDSDDLSVDSTGSKEKASHLDLSEGPHGRPKNGAREYGHMHNSDLVIPQPRKSSYHSHASHSQTGELPRPNFMPKLLDMT